MNCPTLKSFKVKERLKRGQRIADQLPKMMGLQEAADKLGVSGTYVRRVECLALAKLEERMRELLAKEGGKI